MLKTRCIVCFVHDVEFRFVLCCVESWANTSYILTMFWSCCYVKTADADIFGLHCVRLYFACVCHFVCNIFIAFVVVVEEVVCCRFFSRQRNRIRSVFCVCDNGTEKCSRNLSGCGVMMFMPVLLSLCSNFVHISTPLEWISSYLALNHIQINTERHFAASIVLMLFKTLHSHSSHFTPTQTSQETQKDSLIYHRPLMYFLF